MQILKVKYNTKRDQLLIRPEAGGQVVFVVYPYSKENDSVLYATAWQVYASLCALSDLSICKLFFNLSVFFCLMLLYFITDQSTFI